MKFQHTKVENCETWFVGFPLLGFVLSFVLINKGYEFKDMKKGFSVVNLPESRLRCLRIGRIAFSIFYFI